MISQAQILRLVNTAHHARLLQRVLQNGRPCSARIRRRLSDPGLLPVASLALAIQRYIELSYDSRSEEGDRLVARLLAMQGPTGLFGSADCSDDDRTVLTTMAVRTLLDYFAADSGDTVISDPAAAAESSAVRFSAAVALERAARALVERHAIAGMLGGMTDSAEIIDWQLGDGCACSDQPIGLVLRRLAEHDVTDREPIAADVADAPGAPDRLAEAA